MAKFYSIGGLPPRQPDGRREFQPLPSLESNPNLREWLAARKRTSHTRVGIEGKNLFRGDPALVHGEEHDQHSGTVTQYVQRSDPTGSGTYAVEWKPGEGERTMVQTRARRTFE